MHMQTKHNAKTGPAEQVQQTRRSPDQCYDWDDVADPSLVGEKHAYRLHRFVPAQTSWSECKRELPRSENKQLGGHTFLMGAAWNKIQTKCKAKHWLVFVCRFFIRFPGWAWNRHAMPMDTNLRACGREANQNSVTMSRLKRRLQVMFLGPKKASEAISEHPISKKFPVGACLQITLA